MVTITLALVAVAMSFAAIFAMENLNYLHPRYIRRRLMNFGSLKSALRSWAIERRRAFESVRMTLLRSLTFRFLNTELGQMAPAAAPIQQPDINPESADPLRFRNATIERTEELTAESETITAALQRIDRTIEGSGFVYGVNLQVDAIAAGNSAVVAYNEDAPWNILDSVVYRDVNGELINLTGFELFLVNLAMRQYANRFIDQSTDAALYQLLTGNGATGGSFRFFLRVPLGINRRDLLGVVGNQDRAQKYSLRTDIAPDSLVYSTNPTVLPPITIRKFYENYAVPLPQTAQGLAQEVVPPDFGTLHYLTSTLSEAAPLGGSTVTHYIKRLGNTMRAMILIFRENGSRANAQANPPTNIQFKVGENVIYSESYEYRRMRMHEHYGFDFPDGVLIYEFMHDFGPFAGFEMGDDYMHTQALVNAALRITYPAGMGSTGNSLAIVTDDLQHVGVVQR